MQTPLQLLTEKFYQAILTAFPQASSLPQIPVDVAQSTQERFGHYQCNSPMKLAKILQLPPRQIAEAIVKNLDKSSPYQVSLISALEIAGPGFINITLTSEYISHAADAVIHEPHLGINPPKKKQRIIVEYSSPNTAKEMHVGHLRSTIIGDSLARLFEFLGHDVLRLNHIGDWGTAFGMLIAQMKDQAPEVLSGKQKTDLSHLVEWYKASRTRFDADPDFKRRSQLEVVALQSGEKEARRAWEIICDISRNAYQEIYDILDVKLVERGESFYNPMLPSVVADLDAKGLITISDGAKCVFLEGFQNREGQPLPLMVQKSDGGYNYDTTDVAALKQRVEEEKADRIIYVIDSGQSTHMQMVFKASEKAKYYDPAKIKVEHVGFGLVLGTDGKKFRSRSGDTERLVDLLTSAVEEANKILLEKAPDMPPEERQEVAKALGLGAIKYADLSCNRIGDYMFSYERMLRFEGNTAAFLMYAYVRVAGIKRKIKADIEAIIKTAHITLEHQSEVALGMHLIQFGEALDQVSNELLPNRLTDYLFGLAEKFNAFFRDCRVEGTPEQNSRLLLCEATARTLKQGLSLLGVRTVERM
jgi:arginyl-tRNA synthetase